MRKSLSFVFVLLTVFALVLSACGPQATEEPKGTVRVRHVACRSV
jgi:hypothetical protein